MERHFIVWADNACQYINNDDGVKIAKHVVNSASFWCVCTYDHTHNKTRCHMGGHCLYEMVIEFSALADAHREQMEKWKTWT